MVEYFARLWRATQDAFEHKVIFGSYLLRMVAGIVAIGLLFVIDLLIVGAVLGFDFSQVAQLANPLAIVMLVLLGLINIVILVLLFSWFTAGSLTLFDLVSKGKRPTFTDFIKGANLHWFRLLLYELVKILLVFLLGLPLILLGLLLLRNGFSLGLAIAAAVFLLLFVGCLILLSFGLYFAFPLVIDRKLSGWQVITESFRLLWTQPSHTVISVLVTWMVTFAVTIVLTMFSLPIDIVAGIYTENLLLKAADSIVFFVTILVDIILSIIVLGFTFYMYRDGFTPVKARKQKPASQVRKK